MYQNSDLEGFEIPTAKETTDAPHALARPCPDEPGRECMLRHLYAVRKHINNTCAHCSAMASKVQYARKLAAPAIHLPEPAKHERKKRDRPGRVRTSRAAPFVWTEAALQARKANCLAALAKAHTINAERQAAKAAEQEAAREAKRLERNEQRRKDNPRPKRENRGDTHPERKARKAELRKLRAEQAKAKSVNDNARAQALSLELVRRGTKNPSRCQGVVLALCDLMEAGQDRVLVMDLMKTLQGMRGLRGIANSGALGRSLRDYGLSIELAPVQGRKTKRTYVLIDDAAREFCQSGYARHAHGHGRLLA